MPKRQLVSRHKPVYYLEVEDAEDLEHIDDENVTTVTQAMEMAAKLANITGKRVKLRGMVPLGVFAPTAPIELPLVEIDPTSGMVL